MVTTFSTVHNQHGTFTAGPAMTARFTGLTKAALCTLFGTGEVLTSDKTGKHFRPAYYRQFAKADLVVMAGDVFANDIERAADHAAERIIRAHYAPTYHLTHTGPFAGAPMCGVSRESANAQGDRFAHVPYTRPEVFLARPDVCAACKRVWNS